MTQFDHVLIGVDFSDTTAPLLRCASELKVLGVREVTLLHVQPVVYPAAPQVTHRATYEERLDGLAASLRKDGFQVRTLVRSGVPGSGMAAVATELSVDLIVLAAHDHGQVARTLLGSVASQVLQQATVPVLLERFSREEEERPQECALRCRAKFQRPLLATDGSESARAAEALIVRLSRDAQATILLTVLEGGDGQDGHPDLEALAARCSGKVRIRVERGRKASAEIQRVAQEEDASLILVGRRGRGPLLDRLLGSTAENVTQGADRPVLVIP